MAGWEDMTVQDLMDMGISLQDFEAMLDQGHDPFATNYDALGVMSPTDISPQATQWDVLDAQKTARKVSRGPTPGERRQDRKFYMPDSGAFPYDVVTQANPYLRELLNTAISGSKPGPNQPFDVEQYVFGKVTDPALEGYKKGDVGRTRIGKAVTSAMDDFEFIADQFHADDRRWATTNKAERRKLLQDWLSQEASGALEGGAPSVARNVNFSDWATSRQSGEPFGFSGPGFDRQQEFAGGQGTPRVQLDPRYWGKNQTEGMSAQMDVGSFKRAYADTLASQVGDRPDVGQRIDDPNTGGYWVVAKNARQLTPVEQQRLKEQAAASQRSRAKASKGKGKSGRSPLSGIGDMLAPLSPSHWFKQPHP